MAYITTQGTVLAYLNTAASPNAYVTIPKVVSLSGPSSSRSEIDVSNMDSTAKEFQLALVDHGTIDAAIVFDERVAAHAQLRTDFNANTERTWRITDAGSPQKNYTFSARIQSLPLDFATDEVVRVNMTLRITGAVTVS